MGVMPNRRVFKSAERDQLMDQLTALERSACGGSEEHTELQKAIGPRAARTRQLGSAEL